MTTMTTFTAEQIRTLQQTIAVTICHLKMEIDAFKGACQDVLPSSLMNKEEMHVQGILLQINTVPWSRLMFKFEEGLVSETALQACVDLLKDTEDDVNMVHVKLLQWNKKYEGSKASQLYTTKWLETVSSLRKDLDTLQGCSMEDDSDWTCTWCSTKNPGSSLDCTCCGIYRNGKPAEHRDTAWTCSFCSAENHRNDATCTLCGTSKTTGDAASAIQAALRRHMLRLQVHQHEDATK